MSYIFFRIFFACDAITKCNIAVIVFTIFMRVCGRSACMANYTVTSSIQYAQDYNMQGFIFAGVLLTASDG